MELEVEKQWEEEVEEVEEEEEEVPLQGRRPRHSNDTILTSTSTENGDGSDLPLDTEPKQKIEAEAGGGYNGGNVNSGIDEAAAEVKESLGKSVHLDKERAAESTNGYSAIESSSFEANPGNQILDITENSVQPANRAGSLVEAEAGCNGGSGNAISIIHEAAPDIKFSLGKSVYFDKERDAESTKGYSATESPSFEADPGDQILDITEKNVDAQTNLKTLVNHKFEDSLKNQRLSAFSKLPSLKRGEAQKTSFEPFNHGLTESEDAITFEGSEQESTELDVEKVLRKQETHDLFCPNCNSCITKRVILRKRKRRIQDIHHKTKRDKFDITVDTKLEVNSVNLPNDNDKGHDTVGILMDESPPPASNYRENREPEIFRCLSCFSLFIPSGSGFKLFPFFGDKNDIEDVENHEQIPATRRNWFFSIFASDKEKDSVEQGNAVVEQLNQPLLSNSVLPDNKSDYAAIPSADRVLINAGKPVEDTNLKPQQGDAVPVVKQPIKPLLSNYVPPDNKSDHAAIQSVDRALINAGKPVEDANLKPLQGDAVPVVEQLNQPLLSNNVLPDNKSDYAAIPSADRALINAGKPVEDANLKSQQGHESRPDQNGHASSIQEALPPAPSTDVGGYEHDATTQHRKDEATILVASNQGSLLLDKEISNSGDRADFEFQKNDIGEGKTLRSEINELGAPQSFSKDDHSKVGNNNIGTEECAEDPDFPSLLGGLKIRVPSSILVDTKLDTIHGPDITTMNKTVPDPNIHVLSIQEVSLFEPQQGGVNNIFTPTQEPLLLKKVVTDVKKRTDDAAAINNTDKPAATQANESIRTSDETQILSDSQVQIYVGEQEVGQVHEVHELDILKSIVYGGLIELITSLGVVTSAASADAATLNIIALGLANLIGGLFIIVHNLWELRSDHSASSQVDRYKELLGRRENFVLHATIVVLAYLVFGLLPPVLYGFSFRKSDDRDLKLVVVLATSLFCIILLALGKGHVQRPPKSYIKTLLYYVSISALTSGTSYIVGILIKKLLEKLSSYDSNLVIAVPFFGSRKIMPALASY